MDMPDRRRGVKSPPGRLVSTDDFEDDPSQQLAEIVFPPSTTEFQPFDDIRYVEWNSSTKALTEYLAALGVSNAPNTARRIIEEFGTLSDLLTASWWRLRRVVGWRLARTIQSSHQLMRAMLEEQVLDGPVIHRSEQIIELLQIEVGFLDHERVLALYVDSHCRLMRIERVAEGSAQGAQPDSRAIIGCGLSIGAAAFILVHNHPSGDPRPSNSDLELSNRLARVARDLDLAMLDHLIIARGKVRPIFDWWQDARWTDQESLDS